MNDVLKIKNYILYLKQKCALSVTLHPQKRENLIISSELISFNIHESPYCIYVKSHPLTERHCICKQGKVFEKCKSGSFCGTCYAGVTEYVYPIRSCGEPVGFISVSGYACEGAESYHKRTSEKYSIPYSELKRLYGVLNTDMPPKEEVDTLVSPLCDMLELAYIKNESKAPKDESLTSRICAYVKLNHTQNITLDDVCREFSCSRSHISHTFKSSTGMGFREYLAHLRIEDAKSLLLHSKLTVTEIAMSVGFSDSNYFSNVFKSVVGVSPLTYRKKK